LTSFRFLILLDALENSCSWNTLADHAEIYNWNAAFEHYAQEEEVCGGGMTKFIVISKLVQMLEFVQMPFASFFGEIANIEKYASQITAKKIMSAPKIRRNYHSVLPEHALAARASNHHTIGERLILDRPNALGLSKREFITTLSRLNFEYAAASTIQTMSRLVAVRRFVATNTLRALPAFALRARTRELARSKVRRFIASGSASAPQGMYATTAGGDPAVECSVLISGGKRLSEQSLRLFFTPAVLEDRTEAALGRESATREETGEAGASPQKNSRWKKSAKALQVGNIWGSGKKMAALSEADLAELITKHTVAAARVAGTSFSSYHFLSLLP
jgi:hypothetical protein